MKVLFFAPLGLIGVGCLSVAFLLGQSPWAGIERLQKLFLKLQDVSTFKRYLYGMNTERKILVYKDYFPFFIFDEGNIVMLFNGFQKKTQKTPSKEIEKALELKKEYYAAKK